MRYDVEHQRNIAFDLLRLKRHGISVREYFEKDESIIIYGLGFLGKELYWELKEWVRIVCFMDRAHDQEFFDQVPVYSMDNTVVSDITRDHQKLTVVITVSQAWEDIAQTLSEKFPGSFVPVPFYAITADLKLKKTGFFSNKQPLALEIVRDILYNRPANIERIVLVGTSYTWLLSLLMLEGWERTLYLAERFFSAENVKKMTEHNIPCFYEEEAGEFYDITYLIAAYAKRWNIPVYGHDHLFLSRAFLKNSITVIEDGDANYNFKNAVIYKSILDSSEPYYPFGFHDYVDKIFLTGFKKIPEEISHKAEIIEPAALWNMEDGRERQIISDLFSFPYEELKNLVEHGKTILFLTEPYANMRGEDIISIRQMIEMYQEILANYDKSQIIIKPHPSDCVDYKIWMPGYCVIDRQFPVQMISWTEIPLEKIILMHRSTCIQAFSGKYEIEECEEILSKYGL